VSIKPLNLMPTETLNLTSLRFFRRKSMMIKLWKLLIVQKFPKFLITK